MKWLMHLLALSLALAIGTWFVAWWALPTIAALYGVWQARGRATIWTSLLAGVLAWGGLLAYDASQGPVGRLSALIGGMVGASRGTFVVLTLAFAALLCTAATAFARSLRRLTLPA